MSRTSVLSQVTRIDPDAAYDAAFERFQSMDRPSAELLLRGPDGRETVLPEAFARLVIAVANDLAAGHAVLAIPADTLLTPAEVGQLLGLSRPFVVRLLDEGAIPATHLPDSRHRVVKLQDVLAFQARRERRAEGRRRIADAVAESDLPY